MNILSATFYVSFLLVICFCKPTTKPLRKQNKKYDIAMNCPILCSLFKHIQCDNPSCEMVDWNLQNNFTSNKIVLSYGHNGLGNQFYQHSFALSVANAIGARLLVAKIPPTLYLANKEPRHTDVAFELVTQMIPSSNLYENLPMDSYLRKLCTYEAYFLGDRPKDIKNGVGSEASFDKLIQLLSDDQPRCLKLVGYFQEQPLCKYKLRHVWSLEKVLSSQSSVNYTEIVHIAPLQTSSAKSNRDQSSAQNTQHGITYWDWFNETEHSYGLQRPARGHGHSQKPTEFHGGQVLNITHLFEPVIASMSEVLANQYVPRPMDVCIYLRCLPKHYHMNAPLYYDTLLGSMQYDRVIIFENPQCHHPLEADHTVANVRKHLYSTKGIKGSRYRTASPVSVISKGDKALAAVNHSWLFDAEGDSLKVQYKLPHGLAMFLDLYALTRCNKMILPHSSWSVWAGVLSNATEIHVDVPPYHPIVYHPSYTYHDERSGSYFGSSRGNKKFHFNITGVFPM